MNKLDLTIIDCLNEQVSSCGNNQYEDLCDLINNHPSMDFTCDGDWCPKCPLFHTNNKNIDEIQARLNMLNLVMPEDSSETN